MKLNFQSLISSGTKFHSSFFCVRSSQIITDTNPYYIGVFATEASAARYSTEER